MIGYLLLLGLSCGWTLATVPGPSTGSPTGGDRNVSSSMVHASRISMHAAFRRRSYDTDRYFATSANRRDGQTIAHPIRRLLQNFLPFITGGQDAPEKRFPYACSLRRLGTRSHACGGTLIAPNWVLTAAHCFFGDFGLGPTPLVYVGAHGIDDDEFAEVIIAEQVIIHEGFTGDVLDGFDVALVQLSKPSQKKRPVLLAKVGQPVRGGQRLATVGWGRKKGNPLPTILQFADGIQNVEHQNCKKKVANLKDSMICAFSMDQASCEGDSGGPLLIPDSRGGDTITDGNPDFDVLIGIVSFGPRNCDSTGPEVFTSVTSFHGWIDQKMKSSPPGTSKTPAVPDQKTNSPPPPPLISLPTTPGLSNSTAGTSEPLDSDKKEVFTTLLSAAENGDLDAVRAMINAGADIEANDNFFTTPPAEAARKGHLDVVKFLIEAGANIEGDSFITSGTPLFHATKEGHLDVVNALLEAGANANARGDLLSTALHEAARRGHVDIVKALYEAGANVKAENFRKRTPMMTAARLGEVDVVEFLAQSGVDVNAKNRKDGETALHLAARNGESRVIQVLLENGALVNSRDMSEETPLMKASKRGQGESLQVLMKAGADPNLSTLSGRKATDMICNCNTSSIDSSSPFSILCGEGACGEGEKARLATILKG